MTEYKKKILVVGGGISGITAAIEASEAGAEVILVEKNPYLGGRVAQMHRYFPKLCPPSCGLEISLRRFKSTDRIDARTLTDVTEISGSAGDYTVTVKTEPRHVSERCTSCDECAKVCPVERSDEFNYGMCKSKAAYLPYEAAYPARYVIDREACKAGSCKTECKAACKYDAIDLDAEGTSETFQVGSVIFATGWEPYDANNLEELGFGKYPNVITNVMFERLAAGNGPTEGKIQRPSDGKEPATVAFVHCAGSRDENHLKHCSGVCCAASFKQTSYMREVSPDAQLHVYYIDRRMPGRLEDFLQEREADEKICFQKGKVATIEEDPSTKNLTVVAEDAISGNLTRQEVDMVVLATGLVPSKVAPGVLKEIDTDQHGFMVTDEGGLLAVGCAKRPLDVAACVRDATGMTLKALQNTM